MKLTMTDFSRVNHPVAVTIHSLDGTLYQMTALVDGEEQLVLEDSGKIYRSRNLQKLREVLELLPVASITLRQESANDDIPGQPPGAEGKSLEMLFSLSMPPSGTRHATTV